MSRDTYRGKNVGAMGPSAKVETVNFDQREVNAIGAIDAKELAEQLAWLRAEMRKRAVRPEEDEAVALLGHAEKAAGDGNVAGAVKYLKGAGSWAGRVASELGASIVEKLIENQIG